MKGQSISYEGMKEIYNCACDAWKKKIRSMTKVFEDTVLTDAQVSEMFNASSPEQTKVLNKYLKEPGFNINGWDDIEEVVLPYKNPKNSEERCLNAMKQGFAIARAFNGGKELTWENREDYKYFPYKYFDGDSWSADVRYGYHDLAGCSVGLAFKDSKSAKKAYELFPEVYDNLLMFQQGLI